MSLSEAIMMRKKSRHMGNQRFALILRKQKTQISCAVTAKLISAFVFATRIVLFLFFLHVYPKFQASRFRLSMYGLVCVGPGRQPKLFVFSCTGSNTKVTVIFNMANPTSMYRKTYNNMTLCFCCYVLLLLGYLPCTTNQALWGPSRRKVSMEKKIIITLPFVTQGKLKTTVRVCLKFLWLAFNF